MADIWRVTDWRLTATIGPAYEQLIGAIGSEDFGATVRHCVDSLTAGVRRLYLFDASGPGADELRYFHCEPRIAALLPAYSQRYKRLDPIGVLYGAAQRRGDLVVQRIRPSDIGSTGFRRQFFDEPGIVERLSLFLRHKDGWRGLNLARHASQGPFSGQELDAVSALARLALPMPLARPAGARDTPLTAVQLEDRFARRCPSLTARERQVCARAALGLSVEATATSLGIARTSVVTFRQRAYRRLGATSPTELLGLVAN
ncbi:MAG TPA: helix-turn-helix transcriptional regulator [Croceibacterium sp.]|nr:helix-turn-helix transcriptional regulator [Croceibacterium sp.]